MRCEDARTVAWRILDACFGKAPQSASAQHAPNLEPFQAHALHRLSDIIERRGGALLADSVGLGKTHVAAALIRDELDAGGTALVVTPAQLHAHWKRHLRGLSRARWISHTTLSRGTRRIAPATLVVVDEAHAFRNPRTRRYAALALLCEHARVLLITATPVNNSLLDFYNLVRLFAPRDLFTDVGVPDLLAAVESAMRAGQGSELRRVADAVMVRRTRRSIVSGWSNGSASVLRFPATGPIDELHYDMLPDLIACVHRVIPSLTFPAHGLDGDPAPRELMRLGLLKRLESSTWAFHASVRRQMRVLEHFVSAAGDSLLFDPRGEHAHDAEVDGAVQLSLRAITLVPWPRSLDRARLTAAAAHDLSLLRELNALIVSGAGAADDAGVAISADPKLTRLASLLDAGEEKVLLFTEFQETARGLWRALSWRDGIALVHGGDARLGRNRSGRRAVIERFAPIANHARVPRRAERVRLLIATDVLAEGLNLQDASVLVSYDLPWNPVRLAQRIGRIDRLGSPHQRIRAVAFVPDRGVDELLGLMKRIRRKLRHIRVVGGDAPWSLARRSVRLAEEIDDAGDARERAYALWRNCSSEAGGELGRQVRGRHARGSPGARGPAAETSGIPVALLHRDRDCCGALCCFRAGGETVLVLTSDTGPAQVGTAACWTTLADALAIPASPAGPGPTLDETQIAAAVQAAKRKARNALSRRSEPRSHLSAGSGFAGAGAAVLRWLAERPGGADEADMEAADAVLRALGAERRAGADIRLRKLLRSAASAAAAVEALRSTAAVDPPDRADSASSALSHSRRTETAREAGRFELTAVVLLLAQTCP